MAAVDSDVTPTARADFEVVETLALTNVAATATVNRALKVPRGAKALMCLLDVTITGTTPLFDFSIFGGNTAGGRTGATLDSTTDKFEFTNGGPATITQLTTDGSTPIVAINIGPGTGTDTTGSATANSAYSWQCATLPKELIYVYTYDGTTHDEDYAGTISFKWQF